MADKQIATAPSSVGAEVRHAWERGFVILNQIAVDSLITLSVIASIEGLGLIIKWMTQSEGLIFFKGANFFEFNGRWLLDAADIGLLGFLLFHSARTIYRAYKGSLDV
jgi:hypothetical protein